MREDHPTLSFFVRVGAMAPEEAEWAAVPYSYAVRTRRHHGHRIAEDIARRVQNEITTLAYLHQVAAAATHNTAFRLHEIQAPTLVLHRRDDRAMPFASGRELAALLPDARLVPLDGNLHPWELYNLNEDFNERVDLSKKYPEKLKELKDLFDAEAAKYNIYPLVDMEHAAGRFRQLNAGKK